MALPRTPTVRWRRKVVVELPREATRRRAPKAIVPEGRRRLPRPPAQPEVIERPDAEWNF